MVIKHRENWKERKWRVTISLTTEEIRSMLEGIKKQKQKQQQLKIYQKAKHVKIVNFLWEMNAGYIHAAQEK